MPGGPKLLVSACLLGRPVRYDGSAKALENDLLEKWRQEDRVIAVCPELLGGLPTPRPAAEIADGADGAAVLAGQARVVEVDEADVTSSYLDGARAALELALECGCRFALLTDGSPSCGSGFVYDGSFTGRRHSGAGVTTALLREHGIAVFSPDRIAELAALMEA